MRILVADDDVTSRMLLTALLKKCGHEVVAVTSGTEAWEELQKSDAPRLAILDWMMPAPDGPEICRRVRACKPSLPPYLILLTTRSGKRDAVEGLEAGADDHLGKPFDTLELSARVEVGCRMIALQDRLAGNIRELQEALAQIKTLRGIVPICAGCKKIRDDQGFWSQVEAYISAHSEAKFSHGYCPQCMQKYFPGLTDDDTPPTP